MKTNRGITLIEVLVTLVVASIFIAMSINFGSAAVQRAGFSSAFNKFVADYYYARQLASKNNKYSAIVFDVSNCTYSILEQKTIGDDLSQRDSYETHNTISPLNGEPFFEESSISFAISPTGEIRAFPVDLSDDPIGLTLTFFKKDYYVNNESKNLLDNNVVYKKTIRIFPTGGLKIETPTN